MDILVLQIFNSLFYASVLFLIAAGLSLIFGVMRIVNMAHGTFYAVGAFVTAWLVGRAAALGLPAGWMFLLIPVGAGVVALLGAVIEPLLLRPFYRRAEEYQLLVTFGLLLILEDVASFQAWPSFAAHCAAKAAQAMLTRVLARALAPEVRE